MKFAYCGLNCNECSIYLASISNNTAEQIQLAKAYSTDTCEFSKEDMYCLGCHSGTTSEKMCGGCEIRKCGTEKCDNTESINSLKQLAAEYKETE